MKLILSLVVLLVLASPSQAADLFVRKNPPAVEQAPAAPVVQDTAPVVAPAAPVTEAAKTVSEFANQYYKACIAKPDAVVKGESLNTQCSCTSQKIIEEMTIEDVNGMAEATANGEFQRGRILLQAYAPCMQYPARSILLEKCTNDPNMKKTVAAYEQACSCMADRMAQYVALNGPMIIAKSLRSTAPNPNPLSDLMRDPDFQSQAQRELAECVKTPTAPLHPPDQIPLAPSIDEPPPPVNKGIEVQGQ